MNKTINIFILSFLGLFFLFTNTSNIKALDRCATRSLGSEQQAEENCPKACALTIKEGKWLGPGNWLPTKRGMGCMNKPPTKHNYTDSVCGCDNSVCCESCDNGGLNCTLSCQSIYTGYQLSICLTGCETKWGICQSACFGCPKPSFFKYFKEKATSQKTPSAPKESLEFEQKKSPESDKSPIEKEPSLTKEPDNHQEPSSKP